MLLDGYYRCNHYCKKKNISKKQASNNSITEKHNDNIIECTDSKIKSAGSPYETVSRT